MRKVAVAICALLLICGVIAYPMKWLVNYVFAPGALMATFGGPLTVTKALCLDLLCVTLLGAYRSKE